MNFADTLRGLARRWYIVIPGLMLATVLAIGTFTVVGPGYQRTATQLLLPGEGTIPEGATNPFLFLGGLTQSADVLVRSLNSEEVAGEVERNFPGTEIAVSRDPSTSGPIILITVTAKTNAYAAGALDDVVASSSGILDRLQRAQNVKVVDRITISTLTHDQTSTLQQRNRLGATAGVGAGVVILTILGASLMEGLSRRARRGMREGGRTGETEEGEDEPDDAGRDRQNAVQRLSRSWRGQVAGRDRAGVSLPVKGGVRANSDPPSRLVEAPAGRAAATRDCDPSPQSAPGP